MEDVVDFYEILRETEGSKRKLAEKLRNFARQHVGMDVVMKPIEDYINEEGA